MKKTINKKLSETEKRHQKLQQTVNVRLKQFYFDTVVKELKKKK